MVAGELRTGRYGDRGDRFKIDDVHRPASHLRDFVRAPSETVRGSRPIVGRILLRRISRIVRIIVAAALKTLLALGVLLFLRSSSFLRFSKS